MATGYELKPAQPEVTMEPQLGGSAAKGVEFFIRLVISLYLLFMGLFFGFWNQFTPAPGDFRFPALMVSLLMAGMGLATLFKLLGGPPKPSTAPQGAAYQVRSSGVQASESGVIVLILALAVWMGLANLSVEAVPASSRLLAWVASFSLFALNFARLVNGADDE